MRCALPLFAALALPLVAAASSSIGNELIVSGSRASALSPRSGNIADRLSGSFELSDAWELHGDLSLTHENASPAQAGAAFGDTASNILLFDLGGDWAGEHWSFGAEVNFSPKSTQRIATSVITEDLAGTLGAADALVESASSSAGALIAGGWFSGGDSPEATAIDATVSLTHTETTQRVAALETPQGGTVSALSLQRYCTRYPRDCGGLLKVLDARTARINQARLGLNVTQTIRDDTDLWLGAGYSFYDRDPTEVGYYSVATVGRVISVGTGVPVAPVRFTVRAGGAHRFLDGKLSLGLSWSYVRYVAGLGHGNSLGGKVQYRFTRSIRAWISVYGNDDVDSEGGHLGSGSFSVGARYTF